MSFRDYILRYGFHASANLDIYINAPYVIAMLNNSYCLVNATENKVWTCYSIEELEDLLEAKFGGNIAGI